MRKHKIGAVIAAVFAAICFPAAVVTAGNNPQLPADSRGSSSAVAALPCRRQSAGNAYVKDIFLSTPSPRVYTGTNWQDVECAATTFRLAWGQRALVTADFNAEADCNGSAPTNGQWCQTRALLNRAEGVPVAGEPSSFTFDGVAGGVNNWQAHSMTRAWEVYCASKEGCPYRFSVQTRMHDTSVTGLWLDEVAAHVSIVIGAAVPL